MCVTGISLSHTHSHSHTHTHTHTGLVVWARCSSLLQIYCNLISAPRTVTLHPCSLNHSGSKTPFNRFICFSHSLSLSLALSLSLSRTLTLTHTRAGLVVWARCSSLLQIYCNLISAPRTVTLHPCSLNHSGSKTPFNRFICFSHSLALSLSLSRTLTHTHSHTRARV